MSSEQRQGNNNTTAASGNEEASRPVLRRTQPKVTPKASSFKAPVKAAPIVKKASILTPIADEKRAPNSPKAAPSPKTPVAVAAVQAQKPVHFSPAPVINDSPLIDEDDTCSIASSITSSSNSSPCFRKGSASLKKKHQKKTQQSALRIPAELPPPRKIPSPQELLAQRKLKISHYGRKQESPKACKVASEGMLPLTPPAVTKKRCGWLSSQSDPAYITYHDEEWGVPVHDDKMLFELLVLAGAQSEMGWSLILSRRDLYRAAFGGFDLAVVAAFDKKKVAALKAELDIFQQDGKLQAVVDNAGRVLQIVEEFGSLNNYMWSFVNHKPIATSFRTSAQVPVKTPKSEAISKDLVKRGLCSVGPTTIYSFMQAAGMTNDHILQCFRHKECSEIVEQQQQQHKSEKVVVGQEKCELHGEYSQGHQVFVHVC